MKSYIPTINISSLLKSDFNTLASKNTIRKIEKACVDVGFFSNYWTWIRFKSNKKNL